MSSNQREDVDEAIFHSTESIIRLPYYLKHGPIILQALFSLAEALLMRSKVSNQPEDVIYAVKYLFHIRDQICKFPRHRLIPLIVDALVLQVQLELGNPAMQNIREMAVLSHELLTLGTFDVNTTHLIPSFMEQQCRKFFRVYQINP
jgi:hypothetical protein